MVVVVLALVLAVAVGGLVAGLTGSRTGPAAAGAPAAPPGPDPVAVAAASPPTPGARPFAVGVVGSEDPASIDQVTSLGARVVRAEFTPSTTVEQLTPLVAGLAARGVRLQPLVGWDDGTPAPDLTPVARWAAAFGPRGTFWGGRADPATMVDIELGNENSKFYKSGEATKPLYRSLATAYGHRAADAARAVDAANPAVGVLVELESGDSGTSTWIDDTLAAGGPDLVRLLHAPVIHAYGPDWRRKLDENFRFLARRGVHEPYAMTEWGISSDDGADLSDNYGWPTDLTDDRVGGLLSTAIAQMATLPHELGQVMLFQLHDQRDPGTDTDREHYFGLLHLDGSPKGGYTAAARNAYARYP